MFTLFSFHKSVHIFSLIKSEFLEQQFDIFENKLERFDTTLIKIQTAPG